eukprot:gene984-1141_t
MAQVVVVGGGFGGLASAARLAKLGHEVTLLERSAQLGGAMTSVSQDGFTWDAGPTSTLLPAVIRDLFRKSGRPVEKEVELVALDDAEIKYSTVQNWYPGDENGKGGIYNFVTKRALCQGKNSKVSWTQVETGSAITWKYPSCVLAGENSVGEFYSVAVTNNRQQADTGTKMIHLRKGSRSTIVSK